MEWWIYFSAQRQRSIYSWIMYRMRIHLAGLMKCNCISLSCLFVQNKFPVSFWLDWKMKLTVACSWGLLCLMYTHRTWPEVVLKCILQAAKDKTVTGKLSCLCLKRWCVLSLKTTHLTSTIIILSYFFLIPPKFHVEGLVLCQLGNTFSQSESQNSTFHWS